MNMELWNKVSQPPKEALKKISGGRLSGMTDIKPQWRVKRMTEVYGLCGIGWKFEVVKLWVEQGSHEQVFAFADIKLYIKQDDKWSDPIPGNGGNMLVAKEKAGLHSSDEAFKMAITDALSSSMKMIGVASDIYMGNWDGSKYKTPPPETQKPKEITIGADNLKTMSEFCNTHDIKTAHDKKKFLSHYKIDINKTTAPKFSEIWKQVRTDYNEL